MKKSNPNQYTLFGGDYALKGVECRICLKEAETLYSSEPICSTSMTGRAPPKETSWGLRPEKPLGTGPQTPAKPKHLELTL